MIRARSLTYPRVALYLLACVLTACIEPELRRCGEYLCPSTSICVDGETPRCVGVAQAMACASLAEGALCEIVGGPGVCRDGACEFARCGNAIVEAALGEVCDDGNGMDGDGCARDCVSDESCGNGVRDRNESCDDGNVVDGDGCQADCRLPDCGDGVTDSPREVCDDGNVLDGDGCSRDCRSDETCGNGYVDSAAAPPEVCDDGNMSGTDFCTDLCQAATCGDGRVLNGIEPCDDGNKDGTDSCVTFVEVVTGVFVPTCDLPRCGDGYVNNGEQCDDGNLNDANGVDDLCDSNCTDPGCGNGVCTEFEEQCCSTDCGACIPDDGSCDSGETGCDCISSCETEADCACSSTNPDILVPCDETDYCTYGCYIGGCDPAQCGICPQCIGDPVCD